MKEIKRLKCEECEGFVKAINKLNDDRFYCPNCGKNLGIHKTKDKVEEEGNKKIELSEMITPEVEEFLSESNKIENEYSKEALEDTKQAWVMAYLMKDEPFSINYILGIHGRLAKRLNPKIAGKIRDCAVYIGGRACLQSREEIEEELTELCKKVPKTEKEIKEFHKVYENIHPHSDFNGRTGRILMNIQRINIGLPILIIKEKEKYEYYKWFN